MKNIVLLIGAAAIMACQQPQPAEPTIAALEAEIRKEAEMDTALAKKLTTAYIHYVNENPQDTLSPFYLSKAADIYKEMDGLSLKAVNTYNRILHDYPNHPQAARAVFMIGYVFDEKLDDKERAAKSYEHFLATYPNHQLAKDAQHLLAIAQDTLTDEELVAKWLQQAESKNDTNPKND